MKDEKLVQELRKEISRELIGEVEIIKFEVLKRKLFYKGDLSWLHDYFSDWDDFEDLYHKGIHFDWNGDIFNIVVNDLLSYFKDYLEDNEEEKEDDIHYGFVEGFVEILSKWEGYNIYFT